MDDSRSYSPRSKTQATSSKSENSSKYITKMKKENIYSRYNTSSRYASKNKKVSWFDDLRYNDDSSESEVDFDLDDYSRFTPYEMNTETSYDRIMKRELEIKRRDSQRHFLRIINNLNESLEQQNDQMLKRMDVSISQSKLIMKLKNQLKEANKKIKHLESKNEIVDVSTKYIDLCLEK